MIISDNKNTGDNPTQQGVGAHITPIAAKPEVASAPSTTKTPPAKSQALVKPARKAPLSKTAATPVSTTAARKTRVKVVLAPVLKAAPKPLIKAPVKATTAVPQLVQPKVKVTAEKVSKQKKPKLVRDSFTIPKSEYSVLADLKQRAADVATPAKKSELLRAGIKTLAAMTDAAFKSALAAVPTIKTGRPSRN